jgi:predicted metalloprotease with PDZ domain
MKVRKQLDLTHSIGGRIGTGGTLSDIRWGGPLFEAGLASGAVLTAVNGRAYSDDGLKEAIVAAKGRTQPIRLLVKDGARFREVTIDYRGGLRWPWLERTAKGEAPLDRLLAPL